MNDKYVTFKEVVPSGRKTRIVEVFSTQNDAFLGEIRFWPAWRKYTFQPEPDTVFDNDCLLTIGRMLNRMNREIRADWAERRNNRNSMLARELLGECNNAN